MSSTTSIGFDVFARDNASQTFNQVGQSAEEAGTGVEGAGEKMGKFGKLAGVAMAGVAAAAAGAVLAIKGIGQAMENEKVNDRLSAALGTTPAQAKKFGDLASKLYAGAWGESMADVSHSIEAVATSFKGLGTGAALEKATIQAMDFASIFEVDLPKAVSSASQIVKSGLAKDAGQAFDLLTEASQKVPMHLREDVLDATEEYSQFFSTIGLSSTASTRWATPSRSSRSVRPTCRRRRRTRTRRSGSTPSGSAI